MERPGKPREICLRGGPRGLILTAALAALAAPAIALPLDGSERVVALGPHLDLLEDPGRGWTVEDVASPPLSERFTLNDAETPNLGSSDSAWWVRLRLENVSDADQTWILESTWAVADLIELYEPDGAGGFSVARAGDTVPHGEWEMPERYPAFALSLPAGSARTFYVRTLGADTILIPLRLFTPAARVERRVEENLVVGVYFGIFLVLVAYNLLLYSSLRDRTYLYYAAWVGFLAMHQAALMGFLHRYLWPGSPVIATRSLHVFGAAVIAMAMPFTRAYLSTPQSLPRVDPWLRRVEWFYFGLFALALVGPPALFVRVMPPPAAAGALLCMALGVLAWRAGVIQAAYYLAGFGLMLLGAIALAARALAWLPSNFLVDHFYQIAFLLTVLSFSLGLSDRMKRMAEETLAERQRAGELEELKREAEHSNLAKSRVLAAASHDVRQPLHALGLFAQQLREQLRDARARVTLQQLETSLHALGRMLSRLFDMSKLESGSVEPELESFELDALLDRVAAEFEEMARRKGLHLVIEPARVAVHSDVTLLGRILQNLVGNAIQYTDEGQVRVRTRRVGDSVRIEVLDSGPGIPPGKESAVFDEFVRLEGSRGDGLGLGLSIVQGLSQLLDHPVELVPSPFGGAGFRVSLPAAGSPAARATAAPLGLPGPGLEGRLVAVVDDDLAVLEGMRSLFERWGCEVVVAQDAEDLLAGTEARGRAPEVLIADYRLKGDATGVDAVDRVRARWGDHVPVIVITGETTREVSDELRRRGLPHLTKPVPAHKLRALLLEFLRRAA